MKFKTLDEWLSWQETLHPEKIELGLGRLNKVAREFPFFSKNKTKTITVGGTNGKGSCVAYLEAMLLAAGYSVGAYTSPHLLRYNERVRLNGKDIDDQSLCDSFSAINKTREEKNLSLTYFEFGTLAALDIFERERVDVQILEVGLGGRLDAVNIIEPDVAIVTNVALDHQDWLGDTREAIGTEKAGIFRANIPLIIGESDLTDSLLQAAHKLGNTNISILEQDFFTPASECYLPITSAACAIQALVKLGIPIKEQAFEEGLRNARLLGRFQEVEWRGRKLILDVAHNPAAAVYLAEKLRNLGLKPAAIVFSALADKAYSEVMSCLKDFNSRWYLGAVSASRAASLEKMQQSAEGIGVQAQGFDTLATALQSAQNDLTEGEIILVCGSFYAVAEALVLINDEC